MQVDELTDIDFDLNVTTDEPSLVEWTVILQSGVLDSSTVVPRPSELPAQYGNTTSRQEFDLLVDEGTVDRVFSAGELDARCYNVDPSTFDAEVSLLGLSNRF